MTLANLWGWANPNDGKEYALVGNSKGMSIVDVSNPKNISEVVQINGPSSEWREVRTYDHYAYVTTEGGGGLQIVDLSQLPSKNLTVTSWTPTIKDKSGKDTKLSSIHALQIDNGKIYLYGSNIGNKGVVIADLKSNPMAPVYLGNYENGAGRDIYVHDGYARNDTLYAGHIFAGYCEIVDLRNPAKGVSLANFQTPGKFTHNTWLSRNSKVCFTTDEVDDSFLAAYDISNLNNISLLGKIQSNPGSKSVVHNTYIIQKNEIDYAITSWYKDGVTIVNTSDPRRLVQVGNYDTSPLSGSGMNGCWGVYPYLPSGIILASDIQEGLFVLDAKYVTGVSENTIGDVKVISYPNPFSTEVTVSITTSEPSLINEGLSLDLYDVVGNRISIVKPEDRTGTFKILREGLTSGIYFYRISNGTRVIASGKLSAE